MKNIFIGGVLFFVLLALNSERHVASTAEGELLINLCTDSQEHFGKFTYKYAMSFFIISFDHIF